MSTRLSRQKPRVHFRKPVRLRASSGTPVAAIARNLSEGGLYLDATRQLSVGATVRCELDVDGREIALPGTIVWTAGDAEAGERGRNDTKTLVRLGNGLAEAAKPPAKSGMGVRFEALTDDDCRLVHELVRRGEPVTTPVQLHFAGLEEPVRAQASATESGIALHARLPFLELGSGVRFRLKDESEDREGSIQNVVLDTDPQNPAVPRLSVELAFPDRVSSETPAASTSAPEAGPSVEPTAALQPQTARQALDAPARGPAALAAAWALGAAMGAGLAYLLVAPAAAPPADDPQGLGARPDELSVSVARADAPVEPAPPLAPAPVAVHSSEPPASVEEELAEQATATVPAPPGKAAPGPAAAEPAAQPQAIPEVSRAADGATTLFVPMSGDGSDMQIYELTSPGVAITLPHATPGLAEGNYGIHEGVIRRVWLKQHGGHTQVRVIYRRQQVQHQVSFGPGGLTVVLR